MGMCEVRESMRSEKKMMRSETYFAYPAESFYTSALRFIDGSPLFIRSFYIACR